MSKRNRMYDDLAHLWPLISPPEGYAEEARHWRQAIRDGLGPGRHRILELGVGGGNNLSHLTSDFDATAVDVSEKMLANSRRLNPGVEHHLGDMRSVRLDRTFDAVLIHDAIGYLLTEDDLRATFTTAREHLTPGGLFVTAPDWLRETFVGPRLTQHGPRSADGIELTYVEYVYDPDPTDTTIESVFIYFLTEDGVLRVEQDLHTTGLFPLETWLRLIGEAGFEVEARPYPVHEDGHESHLLVGATR